MPSQRKMKRSDASTLTTGNSNNMDKWIEKSSQSITTLINKSACRLCSVYVDEQVEYEERQEDYVTTMDRMVNAVQEAAMNSATAASSGHFQVDLYRQFLFDEDSVMNSVTSRDAEDAEGHEEVSSLNHFRRKAKHGSSQHEHDNMHMSPQRRITSHDEQDYQAIVSQRSH